MHFAQKKQMSNHNWEQFEKKSEKYLNDHLSELGYKVILKGGSNSHETDLYLYDNLGHFLFCLDSKLCPAQCGQIVIIDNGSKFELSKELKSSNPYSESILSLINKSYKQFSENSDDVIQILGVDEVLVNWVKNHYQEKQCLYIITTTKLDSYYSIIPLDEIEKVFAVSAVFRRKRSGTRDVPRKNFKSVTDSLTRHLNSNGISKYQIRIIGKQLLFDLHQKSLPKGLMYFEDYFISDLGQGLYRVKNRAKTNNVNVVFTMNYTGNKSNIGLEVLKNYLNSR